MKTPQLPPLCPHCPGVRTELPQGKPDGNVMIMRCVCVADTDWCVFCPKCRMHMHLPVRDAKS